MCRVGRCVMIDGIQRGTCTRSHLARHQQSAALVTGSASVAPDRHGCDVGDEELHDLRGTMQHRLLQPVLFVSCLFFPISMRRILRTSFFLLATRERMVFTAAADSSPNRAMLLVDVVDSCV